MEFEPEEQQIVELLTKLKDRGGGYPKKLLASRRQMFLSQMASVGMGLGIGEGIKAAGKAPKGGALSHISGISASSVVETVLVIAIVAQASVIAYAYRDKLIDLINTMSSSALAVPTDISIPVLKSSPTEIIASDTPTVTSTETPTASPSSTETTIPAVTPTDNNNGSGSDTTGSTPAPGVTPQPTNGNNGNHYGQTPRPTQEKTSPQATQSTGGGSNGGNGNGNGGKKP
ncbi:MAG: hypothetical protein QM730_25575 [Anaerolineales bacterium]